jgi:hypothetical protein
MAISKSMGAGVSQWRARGKTATLVLRQTGGA